MIFDTIPHDAGMDTLRLALQAILARHDALHLPKTWSYVDLRPDARDSEWLRSWASRLQRSTIGESRRRDETPNDKGVSYRGMLYNWRAALGTLLLFAGADCIRDSAMGEIWPIVRKMLNTKTADLLFVNGNATAHLRDMIRSATSELCLRHGFDRKIAGQDWYNTFWLQIGFSRPGFYGDAPDGEDSNLPGWLAGHLTGTQRISTVAIDLLLYDESLHSPSFFQLWRAMAEFRRGKRDEQSLCAVFAENAWVLPTWHKDLVECLKTKRSIMAVEPMLPFGKPDAAPVLSPRLRWQGNKPEFVFDLSHLCRLDSEDGLLALHLNPRLNPQRVNASRRALTRQQDGSYALADLTPWVVPACCQSVDAFVTNPAGVKVWQENYLLWDGNEDVNVFALGTGQCLENPDADMMQVTTEYILFAADDLGVFSKNTQAADVQANLPRQALTGTDTSAYLLPAGWPSTLQVRTCDEHLLVWQPSISSRPDLLALPAAIRLTSPEQHFDEPIELRVECQPGTTLEAAFCVGQSLHRQALQAGKYKIQGASLSSANPRLRLPLRLTFHTQGRVDTRETAIRLNPAGMLMRKQHSIQETSSWNVLPDDELDVFTARYNQFRVFAPRRDTDDGYTGGWTLWEGDTPHGEVMRDWRPLPSFDGLGAPFAACTGTESQECLPLAASVVDHGMIEAYRISTHDDGSRYLTIQFYHALPSNQRLEIRWWDKQWKMQAWTPSLPPQDKEWKVPLPPSCQREPFALAVALDGERLGACWDKQWYNQNMLMQSDCLQDTARNLRWLRLPILAPRAATRMQHFVTIAGSLLEECWLGEDGAAEWKFTPAQTASWRRASAILLKR